MNELIFIKDLKIYGNIIYTWDTYEGKNYIIKDFIGIEHERYKHEIEFVDNIEDSIKKCKCNLPLETLIDLFVKIDKRYTIYIEYSQQKENSHSDVYVPYVFIRYGTKEDTCIIRNGELVLESKDYICKKDEYECALFNYETDYKDAIFEIYMNIITKIKNKS